MRLKPNGAAQYKKFHDEIWPEMLENMRRQGVRNYSIFLFGMRVVFFTHRPGTIRENCTGTGLHPQIPQWRGSQPQPAQGEIRSGKFLGYLVWSL